MLPDEIQPRGEVTGSSGQENGNWKRTKKKKKNMNRQNERCYYKLVTLLLLLSHSSRVRLCATP